MKDIKHIRRDFNSAAWDLRSVISSFRGIYELIRLFEMECLM